MKIIRFESLTGDTHYGIYSPETNQARLIKGNIFGNFTVSEETAGVKRLLAPVSPPNVLALGLNYREHADETGISYPDVPILFIKGTNSVTGPGSPIVLPKEGPNEVDYEAELAVIIGAEAKNVSRDEAMNCIYGYTCANDVSARDWQMKRQKGQWSRGKSFDTFCPLGPWIVTADEIPDPGRLAISLTLNGSVMQKSNTSLMIFDVPAIISQLSRSMTLLAGTAILTGTPSGVGFTRTPPVFLRPGDNVTVSIEGIGDLTNPVVAES